MATSKDEVSASSSCFSSLTASLDASHFHHTPNYCEENVYLLCKKLCTDRLADSDCSDLFVVFISNEKKQIPMWRQKASQRADGVTLWDYHVICIQKNKDENSSPVVWDLDSTLPFPCPLVSYVEEAICPSFKLFAEFQRFFRIVHAPLFLQYFASDRRHMKDSVGNWISEPPSYEVIAAEDGTVHNLDEYKDISSAEVLKNVEERITSIIKADSTPAKLMSATPRLRETKRRYMNPGDDESTQSPNRLVRRPSRSRSLKFDTPMKGASIEHVVEERECSSIDNDILDILPETLIQSIWEKERKALLEQDPAISQAKWPQQMIAGLPKLFDMIYFLFQSIRRSVITKEEFMRKIV